MGSGGGLSRRGFLGGVAMLAGASGVVAAEAQVTYSVETEGLAVFRTVRGRSEVVQRIASERPAAVVVNAEKTRLFAVNEVAEYQGLPTGSVESFAIAPGSGRLARIGRQGLALAATMPRALAIAPDGRHLVVAAHGGVSYNVLPISEDGTIGRVTQSFKVIGENAAHPHSVVFHPSGLFVLGTGFGSDCMDVFAFEHGVMRRIT